MSVSVLFRTSTGGFDKFYQSGRENPKYADARAEIEYKLTQYSKTDPFLVKKALVSHFFHIPINKVTESLTLEEIEKYHCLALWIMDNVNFAPFKIDKKK